MLWTNKDWIFIELFILYNWLNVDVQLKNKPDSISLCLYFQQNHNWGGHECHDGLHDHPVPGHGGGHHPKDRQRGRVREHFRHEARREPEHEPRPELDGQGGVCHRRYLGRVVAVDAQGAVPRMARFYRRHLWFDSDSLLVIRPPVKWGDEWKLLRIRMFICKTTH